MKAISGLPKAYFDPATALAHTGETICLEACVHKIRKMSAFAFVILRTGRYLVQGVWDPSADTSLDGLHEGCYVRCEGTVIGEEKAPLGFELRLKNWALLSQPEEESPLKIAQKNIDCSLDSNLEHRNVALRNPRERAVFQITQGVVTAFTTFMRANHFTEIHTPKIVTAGAEGGANLFPLEYFDKQAYLAQSPQFYKQSCVAFFDRVYEVGPLFRAERHNTSRHLNEYTGLDFEMGYIQSMDEVMAMETAMLKSVVCHLSENYSFELDLLEATLPEVGNIPCLTFMEAMEVLGYPRAKSDLDPEDEVRLCAYAKESYNSEFIFISHFPSAKRPFYAMDDPENPRLALSFDLLFRGLEITTGGQRIHDYQAQVEKCRKFHIEPEELGAYLDIHKYGMPPHGGLGLGLERLVMKLVDLPNIRMASLYPRDVNRLDP